MGGDSASALGLATYWKMSLKRESEARGRGLAPKIREVVGPMELEKAVPLSTASPIRVTMKGAPDKKVAARPKDQGTTESRVSTLPRRRRTQKSSPLATTVHITDQWTSQQRRRDQVTLKTSLRTPPPPSQQRVYALRQRLLEQQDSNEQPNNLGRYRRRLNGEGRINIE